MRIQENHTVRDATPEEEAALLELAEEPVNDDKAEAYDILMGVSE